MLLTLVLKKYQLWMYWMNRAIALRQVCFLRIASWFGLDELEIDYIGAVDYSNNSASTMVHRWKPVVFVG